MKKLLQKELKSSFSTRDKSRFIMIKKDATILSVL